MGLKYYIVNIFCVLLWRALKMHNGKEICLSMFADDLHEYILKEFNDGYWFLNNDILLQLRYDGLLDKPGYYESDMFHSCIVFNIVKVAQDKPKLGGLGGLNGVWVKLSGGFEKGFGGTVEYYIIIEDLSRNLVLHKCYYDDVRTGLIDSNKIWCDVLRPYFEFNFV